MITGWLEFAANAIGGACAFICLFEGTRRIRAQGAHRKAVLMTLFGAGFCLLYGGLAYWKHHAMKEVAQTLQRKLFTHELRTDSGRKLQPHEREASSRAIARMAFVETGALRHYVDAAAFGYGIARDEAA